MMRLAVGLLVAWVALAGLVSDALAQVGAGHRVALVVGNAGYAELPLSNPINDARAMADSLKQRGFDVTLHENTSKIVLERAILDFGEKLQRGATGLFYYAGHAMEVNGRNYLIPVDAQLRSEQRVRIEAVEVDLILEQMQAARSSTNLVILDACRNNPFEKRFRSAAGGGLALIKEAPKGTLIAYATSPGKVAADGDGKHSLYTEELLKAMQVPGAKVEEVFKAVRVAVSQRSNDTQTPWEASSLTGDFYFMPPQKPETAVAAPAPTVTPAPAPTQAGPNRATIELAYWDSVKASNNPAELKTYLDQFPGGSFAALAKARIAALTAVPAPAPAPAPPTAQAGPSRTAMDATFWDSVKGSSNPAELQAYLAQFPDGTFAALAKARIAALTAPPASPPRAATPQPAPATAAPSQQMAALPPATEALPATTFDGTYKAQVRLGNVSEETAILTIRNLSITGVVGSACSFGGRLETTGKIRNLDAQCLGQGRPPGAVRFVGAFGTDPASGQMVADTTMESPGTGFHGSRVIWRRDGTGVLPQQQASLPSASAPASSFSTGAGEAGFPSRPLRIVVPFPAGGSTDIAARLIAQTMSRSLGQTVVVENRPGAGGSIGSEAAAVAAPDGYTLLLGSSAALTVATAAGVSSIGPERFAAIGGIGQVPQFLVVPAAVPARNIAELVALLKTRQRDDYYGSPGQGSSSAIVGARFSQMAGLAAQPIHYQGAAPMVVDLIAGRMTFAFLESAIFAPHVAAGNLRVLAVAAAQRDALLPEIPTLAELGFADLQSVAWLGLFAPRGIAAGTAGRLNRALSDALRDPEVVQRLQSVGVRLLPLDAAGMDAYAAADRVRWRDAAARAGAR